MTFFFSFSLFRYSDPRRDVHRLLLKFEVKFGKLRSFFLKWNICDCPRQCTDRLARTLSVSKTPMQHPIRCCMCLVRDSTMKVEAKYDSSMSCLCQGSLNHDVVGDANHSNNERGKTRQLQPEHAHCSVLALHRSSLTDTSQHPEDHHVTAVCGACCW